ATESEHDEAIYEFSQLTEHPDGWDLIYHPQAGADNSPAGVVKTVKEWRAANGKPGFKKS
ncbi:TPA: bacteriocin immunity protein, partial [Klebsiella pneumoniae]